MSARLLRGHQFKVVLDCSYSADRHYNKICCTLNLRYVMMLLAEIS